MEINPLFAVEAERCLDEGRIADAIKICLDGLGKYVDYAAAYGILARSYVKSGDFYAAAKAATEAYFKFPNNKQILAIKSQIDEILKNEVLPAHDKLSTTNLRFSDIIFDDFNLPFTNDIKASNLRLIPGLMEYTVFLKKSEFIKPRNHFQELPELPDFPDEIEFSYKTDISYDINSSFKSEDNYNNESPSDTIRNFINNFNNDLYDIESQSASSQDEGKNASMVSETLAKIYEMQGANEAAIEAYLKLANEDPDKREYYLNKIEEIKNKSN